MPSKFNPKSDIPSLASKVIFITGGTAGLGAGSIEELAKHGPAHIFFSGRKQKNAEALINKLKTQSPNVKITFIACDVSSFDSVKSAAAKLKSQIDRLDILMLNAGIMAVSAAVSTDGYETQFATNHLGHALLVELLMPLLESTAALPGADVRIVNMSSVAHNLAPSQGIEFATLRSKQESLGGAIIPGHTWSRYGQSKLAQMLYSEQLAKHHPTLTSVSVHPGIIMTGLFDLPMSVKLPALMTSIGKRTPVEQGHYTQCWAATCPKEKLQNGQYYEPVGVVGKRSIKCKNPKLGEELYAWTQKELQPHVTAV